MVRGMTGAVLITFVFLTACARCRPTSACCPPIGSTDGLRVAAEPSRCVDGLPFQVNFYTGGSVMQRRYPSDSEVLHALPEPEQAIAGEWVYTDIRFPPKALQLRADHRFEFQVSTDGRARNSSGTWRLDGVVLSLMHEAVDGRPLCATIRTVHFLSDLKFRGGTGYPLK